MHHILQKLRNLPFSITLTEKPIVGYQNPTTGAPSEQQDDEDFSK